MACPKKYHGRVQKKGLRNQGRPMSHQNGNKTNEAARLNVPRAISWNKEECSDWECCKLSLLYELLLPYNTLRAWPPLFSSKMTTVCSLDLAMPSQELLCAVAKNPLPAKNRRLCAFPTHRKVVRPQPLDTSALPLSHRLRLSQHISVLELVHEMIQDGSHVGGSSSNFGRRSSASTAALSKLRIVILCGSTSTQRNMHCTRLKPRLSRTPTTTSNHFIPSITNFEILTQSMRPTDIIGDLALRRACKHHDASIRNGVMNLTTTKNGIAIIPTMRKYPEENTAACSPDHIGPSPPKRQDHITNTVRRCEEKRDHKRPLSGGCRHTIPASKTLGTKILRSKLAADGKNY